MSDKDVKTKLTLEGDANGMTAAMERAQSSLKKTEATIAEMASQGKASVDRLQNSFDNLKIKSNLNIEAERQRIVSSFEQIRKSGVASADEVTRAHVAMKLRLRELDSGVSGLSSQFGGLSRVAGLAGAALGGMGIAAIASQLHQAGMSAEKLRNSFEAATGSVAKGKAEYEFARAEAQRLGLDLESVANGYMKIAANAKGTAMEGEKTRQLFSSVTGASRALGLSADETGGIIRALGQMMSKGTVQSEELKSQVGEHLPGAFQIAARAMGVTTTQLSKMLEQGQVVSDEFLPKFADELAKTFPPGEKAMSGMTAETMRLKTAWYELKATVMTNGGDGMFSAAIRDMTGLVKEADSFYSRMSNAYGTLKDFAKNPMDPNLGGKPVKPNYAPLTASERALATPDFNGGFSAKTDSIFTPQFSNRMRSPDEITENFGAKLVRDNPYEAPKKKSGVKHESNKDPVIDWILSRQKEAENQRHIFAAENSADTSAGSFGVAAFKESAGLTTGSRYKKTGGFSLIGPGPKSNSQPYDMEAAYEGQIDQRASDSSFMAAEAARNAEALNSEQLFLAQVDELRGSSLNSELLRIDQEAAAREKNWAMNTTSYAVYEARMSQITVASEQQRTKARQQETSRQLGMAASGFGSMASIADSFYQLSGKKSKEAFVAYQVMKSGETVISTADAAMKAYSAMASIPYVGPALGVAAAAAAVAAGAVQLQSIWSTSPEGGGSISGVSGGAVSAGSGNDFVTQPVAAPTQPGQQVTIVINNPIGERRWFEDNLPDIIRDLRSRNVDMGVTYA